MSQHAPGTAAALLTACLGLTACTSGPYAIETADTSGESTAPVVGSSDDGAPTTGEAPDPSTSTGPAGSTGETTAPGTSSTGETTADTADHGSLCERLGGAADDGIPALAAGLVATVVADDRINGYFLNTGVDAANLTTCLIGQIGAAAGCPGVTYDCLDMKAAHAGLGVSAQDYLDFVDDLSQALAAHQSARPELTADDLAAVTQALGADEADIVEDPDDDLTVYQRVGRKPALRDIVGAPGRTGSFLARVVTDPAVSGFFAAADVARLRTCLTRQLAALDGPVVYGAEVDAPEVEPGVGAAAPCRGMAEAHAGLSDDMQSPVTIDDFMALLADLDLALDDAAVDDADQQAILAALTPLCEQIVPATNDCPGNSNSVTVAAEDLALDLVPVDKKYVGTLDSMLCVDLEVVDDGLDFIHDVRLEVAMDHTWIGDVTIKLVHPDATVLTVLSRPGDLENVLPDNSDDCCGDDSNFSAAHPLRFRDDALLSADDMGKGQTMDNNKIVCKDEDPPLDPCQWKPFPGLGPGLAFADFAGKPASGTWKACFGDSGMGDYGQVSAVSLTLDKLKQAP